ncbi:bifunctional adenosylcobinamide kinase/adenosylcobinamide-phosphate guanylyltransferase [Micromonospora zhanjiangensis]|uniref:Adenosylcobinamide kinase n=1 Tax=Micromonospora zhanjiangensis TaxID=1522057 RepID=A0ABV8KHU7_9ACTN
MSVDGWNTLLVLGGIRSGKSEFAESLVGEHGPVRYVATAPTVSGEDPEWTTRIDDHRRRRPATWTTDEAGADPSRLAEIINAARPDETLLVDDLGGWVTVLLDPAHQPADDVATIAELAAAVRDCAARLVLVSPEVGLSLVPVTPLGRAFADALGSANQAVARACDAVVLVVAGQPAWLKPDTGPATGGTAITGPTTGGTAITGPTTGGDAFGDPAVGGAPAPDLPVGTVPTQTTAGPAPAGVPDADVVPATSPEVFTPTVPSAPPAPAATGDNWTAPTMTLPMVATGLVIQPGMELPLPDDFAGPQALERLATLDIPGAGLGELERVVGFAAATQATATPRPWRSARVLLLHGDHPGGAAAGVPDGDAARRVAQARSGDGPLARLAAEAGAQVQVVEAPATGRIEREPALSESAVESALRYGWRLAEEAADAGVQVLVLAACGAGTDAAAAAVLAATAGAEPAAVLGRVVTTGGQVDDAAWMARCTAVRDALHRTRHSDRNPRNVLADLAGGDIAIATGALLGATARRLPVLLDGPVGVAAALVSRDLAGQARHWCLLPDHGGHPAVRLAADVLGLTPLFNLRVDLGEGATALAALPMLNSVLTLAGALPVHPTLATDPAGGDEEFTEPPTGPGPAAPDRPDETPPAHRTEPDAPGDDHGADGADGTDPGRLADGAGAPRGA